MFGRLQQVSNVFFINYWPADDVQEQSILVIVIVIVIGKGGTLKINTCAGHHQLSQINKFTADT